MTTDAAVKPLIVRFASRLRDDREETLRYDGARQVSQMWNGSEWVDTNSARRAVAPETLVTKVHQETTDES